MACASALRFNPQPLKETMSSTRPTVPFPLQWSWLWLLCLLAPTLLWGQEYLPPGSGLILPRPVGSPNPPAGNKIQISEPGQPYRDEAVGAYLYSPTFMYDEVAKLYKVWACSNRAGDVILYKDGATLAQLQDRVWSIALQASWRDHDCPVNKDDPWIDSKEDDGSCFIEDKYLNNTSNPAVEDVKKTVWQSFDYSSTCDPSVIKVGSEYYLYYGGNNFAQDTDNAEELKHRRTQIGFAISTDRGRTFDPSTRRLVLGVLPGSDEETFWVCPRIANPKEKCQINGDSAYAVGQPAVTLGPDGYYYMLYTYYLPPTNLMKIRRSRDPEFRSSEFVGKILAGSGYVSNNTDLVYNAETAMFWMLFRTGADIALSEWMPSTFSQPLPDKPLDSMTDGDLIDSSAGHTRVRTDGVTQEPQRTGLAASGWPVSEGAALMGNSQHRFTPHFVNASGQPSLTLAISTAKDTSITPGLRTLTSSNLREVESTINGPMPYLSFSLPPALKIRPGLRLPDLVENGTERVCPYAGYDEIQKVSLNGTWTRGGSYGNLSSATGDLNTDLIPVDATVNLDCIYQTPVGSFVLSGSQPVELTPALLSVLVD